MQVFYTYSTIWMVLSTQPAVSRMFTLKYVPFRHVGVRLRSSTPGVFGPIGFDTVLAVIDSSDPFDGCHFFLSS